MKVKVKKTGYKHIEYKVISFEWLKPVSEKLRTLKCTACKKAIGSSRWGIAWVENDGKEQALRLCEQCGTKAESETQ